MEIFFFFNDTATTEIYTLSLHDALPILGAGPGSAGNWQREISREVPDQPVSTERGPPAAGREDQRRADRKSTRLNSSHLVISYAVFCLKKKKNVATQLRAAVVASGVHVD